VHSRSCKVFSGQDAMGTAAQKSIALAMGESAPHRHARQVHFDQRFFEPDALATVSAVNLA
jgi:hypothetical protein